MKGLPQRMWCTNRLLWHTDSDCYGIRTPTFMPYEPFLLGVGVVFNLLTSDCHQQTLEAPCQQCWTLKPSPIFNSFPTATKALPKLPHYSFWGKHGKFCGKKAFSRAPTKQQKPPTYHHFGKIIGSDNILVRTPSDTLLLFSLLPHFLMPASVTFFFHNMEMRTLSPSSVWVWSSSQDIFIYQTSLTTTRARTFSYIKQVWLQQNHSKENITRCSAPNFTGLGAAVREQGCK